MKDDSQCQDEGSSVLFSDKIWFGQRGLGMGSEGSGGTGLGEEGGGGSFGEGVTRRADGFSSFFSSSLSLNFLRLSFVFTITGAKRG